MAGAGGDPAQRRPQEWLAVARGAAAGQEGASPDLPPEQLQTPGSAGQAQLV